jgi:steroid delta-isomerase-like uncharacterized protein
MDESATLELMHEAIDALNAGDRDRFTETGTPQAIHRDLTLHQVFVSKEGIAEWTWTWRAAFPDLHFEITNVFANGEQGVMEGIWTGTNLGELATPVLTLPATGTRIRVPAVMTFTVRSGKIVKSTHYFDLMAFLLQVGYAQLDRVRSRLAATVQG